MTRHRRPFFRFAFAGLILGLVAAQSHAQGGWQETAHRHGWFLDYAKAKAEAKKTGKPLMVVFRCVP